MQHIDTAAQRHTHARARTHRHMHARTHRHTRTHTHTAREAIHSGQIRYLLFRDIVQFERWYGQPIGVWLAICRHPAALVLDVSGAPGEAERSTSLGFCLAHLLQLPATLEHAFPYSRQLSLWDHALDATKLQRRATDGSVGERARRSQQNARGSISQRSSRPGFGSSVRSHRSLRRRPVRCPC